MKFIKAGELKRGMVLLLGKLRLPVRLVAVYTIGYTVYVQSENWAARYADHTPVWIQEEKDGSSMEA